MKTLQVSIKTREGFVFKGVVRPPSEIVSMEGGDFFGDFVEKVSLDSNPVRTSACGGYGVNIVGKIFPKVKKTALVPNISFSTLITLHGNDWSGCRIKNV